MLGSYLVCKLGLLIMVNVGGVYNFKVIVNVGDLIVIVW